MNTAWKIVRIVFGVVLLLVGIYVIIQTQFILRIIDGQMTDGFGFLLTEGGEQYLINKIVAWGITVITIGGGLGLIASTKRKTHN